MKFKYFLFKYIDKFNLNKFIKFIVIFLSSALILSLIEHTGGVLLDVLYDKTLWDYTDMMFNIGKYVCLEMSLVWGIGGIIIYYLRPIINKILDYIPKWLTIILFITFIIDCLVTIITK